MSHRPEGGGAETPRLRTFAEAEIPEAEIEIRIAEGSDGEVLAELQAKALWEVTRWQLAQNNSEDGRRRAG
ncbi:hypothetical protein [Nocardia altamirensis]|uniref:hypothetical protein n=1 Tax=Nocardia altamirensis TaxID=472158 RepID=UPI00114C8D0E|nr:hypothetical protein [Nocardia altamirensis]